MLIKRRPVICPVCGTRKTRGAITKHVRHCNDKQALWLDQTNGDWITCTRCNRLIAPESEHALGLMCPPIVSSAQRSLYLVGISMPSHNKRHRQCSYCGQSFRGRIEVSRHKMRLHGDKEPILMLPTERWWMLMQCAYGFRCAACNEVKPLTKDHIVPRAMAGGSSYDNIQPLCYECNHTKANLYMDYRTQEKIDAFHALLKRYSRILCAWPSHRKWERQPEESEIEYNGRTAEYLLSPNHGVAL